MGGVARAVDKATGGGIDPVGSTLQKAGILDENERLFDVVDNTVNAGYKALEDGDLAGGFGDSVSVGRNYLANQVSELGMDGIGDVINELNEAEVRHVGNAVASTGQMLQGDVSQGYKLTEDSTKEFLTDRNVLPIWTTLLAMYGGSALGAAMGGGTAAAGTTLTAGQMAANAAGAGLASAGTSYTANRLAGEENGDDLFRNAARAGASAAVSQYGGELLGPNGLYTTGSRYVDAGLRGAGTGLAGSALRGNEGDQLWYDAGVGGLSSLAGTYAGDTFNSQYAANFAGAGTNLALHSIFESPNEKDSQEAWEAYYNNLMSQFNNFRGQYDLASGDGSGGFNMDELQTTPEGQQLLSLFDIDESDPTKKTSRLGGAGQYGQGGDQIEQQDPSITGEYTV